MDSDAKDKDEGLPLEPRRNIRFDTDEAAWMSLDVSPDGRTIIFDLMGDVYTVDADGGEATVLLAGLAFESQPAGSPDGSLVARPGSQYLLVSVQVHGQDGQVWSGRLSLRDL